jgi:hypothetical protein
MTNLIQAKKIKKSQKEKNFQLFLLVSILLMIGEIKFFSSLVLAQSNTAGLAISKSNKLVSTTATYEDPENPNIKINATSNDIPIKDLTINYNDLLFENEQLEIDIFLINLDWEILLESDFSM